MTPYEPQDGDAPGIGASTPGSDDDPWMPDGPEPTDLILLWPDATLPAPAEALTAVECALDDELERDESFEPDNDAEWVVAVDGASLAAPLVLWAERAHPVPEDLGLGSAVHDVRWVIGLETLIHPADPLTSYTSLMRLLAAAFPHSPAMLDLASLTWRSRAQIESLFLRDDVEPSATVLWTVHTVGEAEGALDRPVWMHTHGLGRCGRPELELLEIPLNQSRAAFELLQQVGMSILEHGAAPAGEPVDIGLDATISLQPWEELVSHLSPGAPGGRGDRKGADQETHLGVRAAICDPAPRGAYRRVWAPPLDLIGRIARSEAILFATRRESSRLETLAQRTWDQFATAFASWTRSANSSDHPRISFGVKVAFEVEDEPGDTNAPDQDDGDEHDVPAREHLWVEVNQVNGDGASGALVNRPLAIAGLEEGQLITVRRTAVTDWRVDTPRGAFGPEQLDALWETIDALRRDHDQTLDSGGETGA